jgi:hypothetical protein
VGGSAWFFCGEKRGGLRGRRGEFDGRCPVTKNRTLVSSIFSLSPHLFPLFVQGSVRADRGHFELESFTLAVDRND